MSFNRITHKDYIKYHLDNDNNRVQYSGNIKAFINRKLFWKANIYIYLEENDTEIEHTQLTWYSDKKVMFSEIGKLIQPTIDEFVNQSGKPYFIDSYCVLRPSLTPFNKG